MRVRSPTHLEHHVYISRVASLSSPANTAEWLDHESETLAISILEDCIDLIEDPHDRFLVLLGRLRRSPGFKNRCRQGRVTSWIKKGRRDLRPRIRVRQSVTICRWERLRCGRPRVWHAIQHLNDFSHVRCWVLEPCTCDVGDIETAGIGVWTTAVPCI
jgi:hypothetical protein